MLKETRWFAMTATGDQELIPEEEEEIEKAVWAEPSEFRMILENTWPGLKKLIGLLPGIRYS